MTLLNFTILPYHFTILEEIGSKEITLKYLKIFCDMVKHHLGVASYVILVTSLKPKNTIWNSKVRVPFHKLRVQLYEFQFTSYESKSRSYGFKSTSYDFKYTT